MPFIHWLPKNNLRKALISLYVVMRLDRKNAATREGLEGFSHRKRVEFIYDYSIRKTFYRSYSEIRRIFENEGFTVTLDTLNHPLVEKNPILSILTKFGPSKTIIEYLIHTFVKVTLITRK